MSDLPTSADDDSSSSMTRWKSQLEDLALDPTWRLVLQFFPLLGGFLAEYHAQWSAEKLQFQAELVDGLVSEQTVEDLAALLSDDPMLRACMNEALNGTAEAVNDDQRKLLRRVMRRAIERDVDVDVAYYQLATLRELTPAHLNVLRIIDERQVIDPPAIEERQAQSDEYVAYRYGEPDEAPVYRCTTDIAAILETWKGVEPILDSVMGGLLRLGLIEHLSTHGIETETERFVRTGFAFHLLRMLRDDVEDLELPAAPSKSDA